MRADDAQLVAAARDGDTSAFAELIARHQEMLHRCCRRMLGDADLARDAAQEAVLRALLGLDGLRDDGRFAPWLVGIGLNACRELMRASRALPLDAFPDPGAGDPLERACRDELSGDVRRAIAALPPGQRRAAALFYLAGFTHAEIAEELGTRPGAVKTRLHKARRSLRASLSHHDEEQRMTDSTMVPMQVAEVRRAEAAPPGVERHILVLVDENGDRRLPIWIGAAEAMALAVVLEDVPLPRPGAYQFAASLLTAAGAQLREVRITELTAEVFYAQAVLGDGTVVDARPSDAITLALVSAAPIAVDVGVLEQSARRPKLRAQADAAPDDASVIADEVRARYRATAAALAAEAEAEGEATEVAATEGEAEAG